MTVAKTQTIEQWRAVVNYEGLYEVSDLGRVQSLDRWVTTSTRWGGTTSYRKPGRVLAVRRKKDPKGAYAVVTLSRDGIVTTYAVHTLVLEAFVGPRPPGAWALHGPLGLADDSLANLRWGTPQENAIDRVRDGNNYQANATRCPWGHRLTAPNLDPSQQDRGFRRCFACALTQMWGRNRGLRPGDPEWLAEAHRRYEEILHFGAPINYRLAENRKRGRWTPNQPWKTPATPDAVPTPRPAEPPCSDPDPEHERWAPIVGFENIYEVSNWGRVHSLTRWVEWSGRGGRTIPGQDKSTYPDPDGYLRVNLARDGKKFNRLVHQLVLEAFVGPCPMGLESLHRDNNPGNPRLENLRWGTQSENNRDRIRHGVDPRATKTTCPEDHPLFPPNLMSSADGGRRCLTCSKARDLARYRGIKRGTTEWVALLATVHAEVMGADTLAAP